MKWFLLPSILLEILQLLKHFTTASVWHLLAYDRASQFSHEDPSAIENLNYKLIDHLFILKNAI